MIDVHTERVVRISEAARSGFPYQVSDATINRWMRRGVSVRGSATGERVVLDTIRVGGIVYTSTEAIDRFIAAQNPAPPQPVPAALTAGQQSRQHRATMAQLAEMGCAD